MPWYLKVAMLAPAVYLPWLWYPASEGGHVVFQLAVLLGVGSLLRGSRCSAGSHKPSSPGSTPGPATIYVWVVAIIFSTLISSDPIVTLFSSHMRGEGALQHLFYAAFLVLLLRAPNLDLRWLVYGGLAVLLGGLLPTGWPVSGMWGLPRFAGSVGNPLYLATGLTFTLWAAIRLRWWHVAIPVVAALVATQSKGAALGLVVALAYWLWTTRKFSAAALVTSALALGMCFVPIPTSGSIRAGMWKAAVEGIVERPWGWGAENYPIVWDRHFVDIVTPDVNGEPVPHYWHDRAHNVYLDRAVEWGLQGLAVWLFMLGLAWKRGDEIDRTAIVLYAVQALFMFDMMMSMIGACVLIAWCWRRE